jgi:membrane protein
MLWFYISGLAIVSGSEMNAEIEHASPHGKAPGEKVPGQKKKIGPRAARAFEEAQRRQRDRQPAASPADPRAPRPAIAYAILGAGTVLALFRKLTGAPSPTVHGRGELPPSRRRPKTD